MKRVLIAVLCAVLLAACQKEEPSGPVMNLRGQIRGLKKGSVYLERLEDSLIRLDSVPLYGSGKFEFSLPLDGPELLYIYLEKKDDNAYNDRFPFFAEPGELTFSTRWDQFEREGELRGSTSDSLYRIFQGMISQFNIRDLELARRQLAETDSLLIDSLEGLRNKNQIARVRYALNFAFAQSQTALAPFAVVTEAREANRVYIDSLWNLMGAEARNSRYGRELAEALGHSKPGETSPAP